MDMDIQGFWPTLLFMLWLAPLYFFPLFIIAYPVLFILQKLCNNESAVLEKLESILVKMAKIMLAVCAVVLGLGILKLI